MKLVPSELNYDYKWTAYQGDDPKITGSPDNTLLNRNEGYEMLYFINRLAEIWKLQQKISLLKIEKMIKNHLPSNIRSQINVKNWIYSNWKKYY